MNRHINLKPGSRLRSTTCSTEVIIVRAGADDVDLRCGGAPMVELGEDAPTRPVAAQHSAGTLLGKRYVDETGALELLCTKAGEGSLSVADAPLAVKESKPLPSSD